MLHIKKIVKYFFLYISEKISELYSSMKEDNATLVKLLIKRVRLASVSTRITRLSTSKNLRVFLYSEYSL